MLPNLAFESQCFPNSLDDSHADTRTASGIPLPQNVVAHAAAVERPKKDGPREQRTAMSARVLRLVGYGVEGCQLKVFEFRPMPVKGAAGDPCATRNFLHRASLDALVGDESHGCVQCPLAGSNDPWVDIVVFSVVSHSVSPTISIEQFVA